MNARSRAPGAAAKTIIAPMAAGFSRKSYSECLAEPSIVATNAAFGFTRDGGRSPSLESTSDFHKRTRQRGGIGAGNGLRVRNRSVLETTGGMMSVVIRLPFRGPKIAQLEKYYKTIGCARCGAAIPVSPTIADLLEGRRDNTAATPRSLARVAEVAKTRAFIRLTRSGLGRGTV